MTDEISAIVKKLDEVVKAIAANSCCTTCREAALVAKSALSSSPPQTEEAWRGPPMGPATIDEAKPGTYTWPQVEQAIRALNLPAGTTFMDSVRAGLDSLCAADDAKLGVEAKASLFHGVDHELRKSMWRMSFVHPQEKKPTGRLGEAGLMSMPQPKTWTEEEIKTAITDAFHEEGYCYGEVWTRLQNLLWTALHKTGEGGGT